MAKKKINEAISAEQFYREKFRDLHKMSTEFSLSVQSVNLEVAMRWAHEFKDLHVDHEKQTIIGLELENRSLKLALLKCKKFVGDYRLKLEPTSQDIWELLNKLLKRKKK